MFILMQLVLPGVKFGGNDTAIVQSIETHRPKNVQSAEVAGSKYEGALKPAIGPRFSNEFANAISGGINIDGNAIGLDKLDHFFFAGYHESNKPEATARANAVNDEKGLRGLASTGVYSPADIGTTMAGFNFYNDLEAAFNSGESFEFNINDYPVALMDENQNKNTI